MTVVHFNWLNKDIISEEKWYNLTGVGVSTEQLVVLLTNTRKSWHRSIDVVRETAVEQNCFTINHLRYSAGKVLPRN